jgi:hypothetical protein
VITGSQPVIVKIQILYLPKLADSQAFTKLAEVASLTLHV